MNIADILKIKFPFLNSRSDYRITDDGDGQYLSAWNVLDIPMPTQEQLDIWSIDPTILAGFKSIQNTVDNKPILDQLQTIDLASIRALRTNDIDKITALEAQAKALRANLVK